MEQIIQRKVKFDIFKNTKGVSFLFKSWNATVSGEKKDCVYSFLPLVYLSFSEECFLDYAQSFQFSGRWKRCPVAAETLQT